MKTSSSVLLKTFYFFFKRPTIYWRNQAFMALFCLEKKINQSNVHLFDLVRHCFGYFFCLAIPWGIFCICHYLNFYSFAGFTKKLKFCNIFSSPLVVVNIDPVSEMAGLNLQKEKQVCLIICTSVDLFILHLNSSIIVSSRTNRIVMFEDVPDTSLRRCQKLRSG